MSKKRALEPVDESETENDDDFDPLEFAALENYENTGIKSLKKLNEKRGTINNTAGLLAKTREISLPNDWPWIETLTVYTPHPVNVDDIEDDLKREKAFYEAASAATQVALVQLEQSGVPYKRPSDFYAESVKPDSHMAKVKQVLLNEKKRVQEIEERKKQRESRKFAKSVHAERVREKALKKRQALDKIEQFKKKQSSSFM